MRATLGSAGLGGLWRIAGASAGVVPGHVEAYEATLAEMMQEYWLV